ncbi:MAG: SMP-30/gluconolactonase/LRE family protein, partial [Candidatus Puniceispirillaceae bacterium]
TPSGRRVLLDCRDLAGRPDGATVDIDGGYWFAGVGGWQVVRVTPDGKVDRIIEMPVEKPSKVMFGGADLDTLYVTSISEGVSEGSDQPEAGSLFAVTGLGTAGLPQARFRG